MYVINYIYNKIPFLSKIVLQTQKQSFENYVKDNISFGYKVRENSQFQSELKFLKQKQNSNNDSIITLQAENNNINFNNDNNNYKNLHNNIQEKSFQTAKSLEFNENNKLLINLNNKNVKAKLNQKTDKNALISVEEFNKSKFKDFLSLFVESSENIQGNYQTYVSETLESFVELRNIDFIEALNKKPNKITKSTKYILNQLNETDEIITQKKTLILDLDETLIHSNWGKPTNKGQIINFKHSGEDYSFELFIRKWVPEFLKKMSEEFDIYIFTAGKKEYADIVIDIIDPENKYIKNRFYREDCIDIIDKAFIKDLRLFPNINLNKTIIVDNSMYAFKNQLSNGILINSYYGDENDNELLNLTSYIQNYLINADDVRKVIEDTFGFEKLMNEILNEKKIL